MMLFVLECTTLPVNEAISNNRLELVPFCLESTVGPALAQRDCGPIGGTSP